MELTKTVLPPDFDGMFRFTNWTEEDFTAGWNGKNYTYPAMKMTPMIIPDATPLEIQGIRKLHAKKLAEREFFKSQKYNTLSGTERNSDGSAKFNSFQQAGQYTENDLAPYIQKCLDPLPEASVIVTEAPPENIEEKLTRDENGELNTQVVSRKGDLKTKNKDK